MYYESDGHFKFHLVVLTTVGSSLLSRHNGVSPVVFRGLPLFFRISLLRAQWSSFALIYLQMPRKVNLTHIQSRIYIPSEAKVSE